jgi:hypothetical protein
MWYLLSLQIDPDLAERMGGWETSTIVAAVICGLLAGLMALAGVIVVLVKRLWAKEAPTLVLLLEATTTMETLKAQLAESRNCEKELANTIRELEKVVIRAHSRPSGTP